ncbi:hypothetical protein V5G65_12720 [Mammaliicoccus sciuri]|uniref:hypothetical protein n=1 Tax=Mammaliicoccus sciuri TaxID=1296 RepID=UPI00379D7EEA
MGFNIILSLIATGIPGLFSYWILAQLDIIFYNNNQNSSKSILTISLSLLNIFISFVFLRTIDISLGDSSTKNLIIIFIVSLIMVWILSMYIYPYIFRRIQRFIDKKKMQNGASIKSNYKVLPRVLHERPSDKKFTEAYIFDFDNNLILEGSIGNFSYTSPEISIENSIDTTTTYEQAINIYNKTKNQDRDVYIDYERKIKMILIHF